MDYTTKDSGKREEYQSWMRRDTQEGKPRYDLIPTWFLKRLAWLFQRGAIKYWEDNYQLADSREEYKRFRASGRRHFIQVMDWEDDEDHKMSVVFNLIAMDMMEQKWFNIKNKPEEKKQSEPCHIDFIGIDDLKEKLSKIFPEYHIVKTVDLPTYSW